MDRASVETPGPKARSSWAPAIAIGATLLATLPFAGKPFHIDDAAFLAVARNALAHPARPFSGAVALDARDLQVFAEQGRRPSTFEAISHPPLVPYLLAAAGGPLGFRETPLHLAFLGFPVLLAVALLGLARRFTQEPLNATLVVVSSPIFALCSQSLMTDTPAAALTAAAVLAFVSGVDRGSIRLLALAGAVAGLAALTRYLALAVLPLLLAYALLRRRPATALPALGAAGAVLGAWLAQNWACCGELHLVASTRHYLRYYAGTAEGLPGLLLRTASGVAGLGGCGLALSAALVVGGGRGTLPWLGLAAALGLGLSSSSALGPIGSTHTPEQRVVLCAFLGLGFFQLLRALRAGCAAAAEETAEQRADRLFLLLWLSGMLAASLALLPFGTSRYMLAVLPPLALLLARAGLFPGARRGGGWLPPAAFAASLLLGLAMSAADLELASAYRNFAAASPAARPGGRLYFLGDWGFRHYMEAAGGRYLAPDDDTPSPGDVVVRPRVAALHDLSARLRERVSPRSAVAAHGRSALRTLSYEARAGFWSHGWGLLPFGLSTAPLEVFDVYEVR